jgi:CubicO group peptidase (beta-lactamase class C family)
VGGRRSLRQVVAAAAATLLLGVPAAHARTAFDSAKLDRELRAEPGVLSVVVARNDRIVFERYYRGSAAAADLDVFSVTKSVTSLLVGIALQRGDLPSLDRRLGDFFPRVVRAARDRRVRRITLRQLLTMTTGYHDVPAARSDDWVRTQIDRPLATDPGAAFAYDNGSYHLLSAVLTRVTGGTALTYANRVLFGPLGIHGVSWATDGQGHSLGNTGLRLRSRDLLKIGELVLHGGRWHGRRVVPAGYLHAATSRQTGVATGIGYGYGWWIVTAPKPASMSALGYGGQAVAVFPSRHVVVVVTGSGDNRARVIYGLVLPALRIG